MSYPAQNTDTQYQCLVREVQTFRELFTRLRTSDNYAYLADEVLTGSNERLLQVFRQFEFEAMFGVPE